VLVLKVSEDRSTLLGQCCCQSKASEYAFVSQLNTDALLHEKDLFFPPPSLSFSPLAQATLHNLIASLDKYPALVEITCTANMPARQYTDELNPDG